MKQAATRSASELQKCGITHKHMETWWPTHQLPLAPSESHLIQYRTGEELLGLPLQRADMAAWEREDIGVCVCVCVYRCGGQRDEEGGT
jgi:hypothetical protein